MNVNKKVMENIKDHLLEEQSKLSLEIKNNCYKINTLSERNTLLKRERAKISEIVRGL